MQAITLELADAKNPLYERLSLLGLPANKTEHYKHFAVKALLEKEYTLHKRESFTPLEGEKLVIRNGVVVEFPKGVKVSIKDDFKVDMEHYDALYYLSHVLTPAVICIEVFEDAVFELEHEFTQKQTFLPYRLFFQTAPNTKVEVFEKFQTQGSEKSLLLYGVDADVSADSTLRWIREQNSSQEDTAVIGTHHYNVAKQGALELKTFDFGSGIALHLYKIDLSDYAWADASHLVLATEEARRGNVVLINHNKPYAKSVQEARTILKDKATGIFDGRIRVGHEARFSNAKQNSKAVLLSENASMYAKPQLEIYIDELEASHGSTIGQLDIDALFYLRSRGIALDEARKMLVLAFADTLIDTIGNKEAVDKIHADFEATYYN
ncbi:MAG: Fe-S cluster assembly protein SufD [Sulfurimonas sp.]|jgi:Fe-S cluster assembly protein SufD